MFLRLSAINYVHWSKDFVEHLRTVHFALVAVSVGLVLILSKASNPALSEIRQIVRLKKEWPPGWLNHAWVDNHGRYGHPENGATVGPYISWKDTKSIYGVLHLGWQTRVVQFAFPKHNWHAENPDSSDWPLSYFPTTLSNFRDWWNGLRIGRPVYFPVELCENADVYESEKALPTATSPPPWRRVGSVTFPAGWTPKAKEVAAVKTLQLDLEPHYGEIIIYEFQGQQFKDRPMSYEATDDIGRRWRRFDLSVCAVSRVDLNQGALINGLSQYQDEKWASRTGGTFEKSFRALAEETSELEPEDLEEVEKSIAERLNKKAEEFEAFGMKFPIAQVTTWGTVILLGVQLYFLLYLKQLSGKLGPDDPGWDTPWICMDQSFMAQTICFITLIVLPAAAMFLLGGRAFFRMTAGYWAPDSWRLLVRILDWDRIVLLQIVTYFFSIIAALVLGILSWRFRPRLSQTKEKQCPSQLFE